MKLTFVVAISILRFNWSSFWISLSIISVSGTFCGTLSLVETFLYLFIFTEEIPESVSSDGLCVFTGLVAENLTINSHFKIYLKWVWKVYLELCKEFLDITFGRLFKSSTSNRT